MKGKIVSGLVFTVLPARLTVFPEKSDRGIRGYELIGGVGEFSTWKIQGKLGGYAE